jgi:hypothetical protein
MRLFHFLGGTIEAFQGWASRHGGGRLIDLPPPYGCSAYTGMVWYVHFVLIIEPPDILRSTGVSYEVNSPPKDWLTTLLLTIFLGTFGVQSFYTGKILFGVLQLLTLGGCGIWTIVDIILIATGSYRDAQGRPLVRGNY